MADRTQEVATARRDAEIIRIPPAPIVRKALPVVKVEIKGFNEDQPRDDHGRWTDGGASSEPGPTPGYRIIQIDNRPPGSVSSLPPLDGLSKSQLEAMLDDIRGQRGRARADYLAADAKVRDRERVREEAVSELRIARGIANRKCGDAWDGWVANVGRVAMPEMDDLEALANLTPAAREYAAEYRRTQELSVQADDLYRQARDKWDRDNPFDEVRQARTEANDKLSVISADSDRLGTFLGNYDRRAGRLAQTTTESREPRNTSATIENPIDAEASRQIDLNSASGKSLMFSSGAVAAHTKNERGENVIVPMDIKPNFKATITSRSDFRNKMEKLFPGIELEGVPTKADMHILTQVHDELRSLRDEFPEVALRGLKLNAGGYRGVAYGGEDRITLAKKTIESFAVAHAAFGSGPRRDDPNDDPGFHDGVRSFASVVRHEFGHQLDFQHPEIKNKFNAELAQMTTKERTTVSKYALKDRAEFFAETFSFLKYGDHGTRQHPALKALDKVMKAYFKSLRESKGK